MELQLCKVTLLWESVLLRRWWTLSHLRASLTSAGTTRKRRLFNRSDRARSRGRTDSAIPLGEPSGGGRRLPSEIRLLPESRHSRLSSLSRATKSTTSSMTKSSWLQPKIKMRTVLVWYSEEHLSLDQEDCLLPKIKQHFPGRISGRKLRSLNYYITIIIQLLWSLWYLMYVIRLHIHPSINW